MIINTYKYYSIVRKQITREHETRVDHRAPVGMEASIAFWIGDELAAFIIIIAALGFGGGDGFAEIVFVDEIVAGVVGRVDIDELDFAGVVLAQELQRVEVVSLDVQVLGGVPVLAAFLDRTQGLGDGFADEAFRLAFAGPSELVAFPVAFRHITKSLFQRVEVHRAFGFAGLRVSDLGGHVWEQGEQPVHVLLGQIRCDSVDFLDVTHSVSPCCSCSSSCRLACSSSHSLFRWPIWTALA